MPIDPINHAGSVEALAAAKSVTRAAASSSAEAAPASVPTDTAALSDVGSALAKLTDLQQKTPAKFKEVMDAASSKLADAAEGATDHDEKAMLSQLASKLEAAGKSGDVASVASHIQSGGKPAASGVPKPGDTNRDGRVSERERQAYEAKLAAAKAGRAYKKHADVGAQAKVKEVSTKVSAAVNAALGAAGA